MGTRIRHLEFYGYVDQNVFNGPSNIDLSDIREKNTEQDIEINDLSGKTQEKADKAVVEALNEKLENFISAQSGFDESVIEALSGYDEDIEALSAATVSLSGSVNEINGEVETLSGDVNTLKEGVEALSATTDMLSGEVETKLSKEEADETYMQIVSAYTKEEIDEMKGEVDGRLDSLETAIEELSGETSGYATKEELNALSSETFSKFEEVESELLNKQGEIDELSSTTQDLSTKLDELSGKTESGLTELSNAIDEVNSALTQTIANFSGETQEKFNEVDTKINAIELVLDTKAKESDLEILSGTVNTISGKLDTEIAERIAKDESLDEDIEKINNKINFLSGTCDTISGNVIAETERAISAETEIIGHETDGAAHVTIYGAKAYAKSVANSAYASGVTYTDGEIYKVSASTENQIEALQRELNNKANSGDVETYVTAKIQDSEATLNAALSSETANRISQDEEIRNEIEDLRDQIVSSSDTKAIYDRINIITTYSGGSAEEYIDSGNGILDVLHREFHHFVDESGVIVNPTLITTHKYESAFGHYNISNTGLLPQDKTVFSIGIGESDNNRKNALEIREDGSIWMWVEGEFMQINSLLAMMAHEVYDNNTNSTNGSNRNTY